MSGLDSLINGENLFAMVYRAPPLELLDRIRVRVDGRMLYDQESARLDPATATQCVEDRSVLVTRRQIKINDIPYSFPARGFSQKKEDLRFSNFAVTVLDTDLFEILAEQSTHPSRAFDKCRQHRAAGNRFDADGPGTGTEIENAAAFYAP